MKFFEFPESEIDFFSAKGRLEGETLNPDLLDRAGVFILRGLFSAGTVQKYLEYLHAGLVDGTVSARKNHLTEVSFGLDSSLAEVLLEKNLIAILPHFFNGRVALHNIRIIRKDQKNCEPVFTHQDSPYCQGFFERFSLFVALSRCGPSNGGIFVYPGTHHFGGLGDAGSIKPWLTDKLYKFSPTLMPGDCMVMHSAVWHGSPRNETKIQRILFDIQIQHLSDPSSLITLCAEPLSPWRLRLANEDVFSTSRVQRASGNAPAS